MTDEMTGRDREQLVKLVRARARQAVREADMREKILLAEVQEQLTAEFDAHDRLWADAVVIAQEAAAKANAHIRSVCSDLGIPPKDAPGLELAWRSRNSDYADKSRRAELRKLAETKLAALTKVAKTEIQGAALDTEEQLVIGGLTSDAARQFVETTMPTVEGLMPALGLDDLGVKHWQPPEDAASQLTTPMTASARKRRQVLRAIEANPTASNREIARIANCDHKTVAAYRAGEIPAITGEIPTGQEDS